VSRAAASQRNRRGWFFRPTVPSSPCVTCSALQKEANEERTRSGVEEGSKRMAEVASVCFWHSVRVEERVVRNVA